MINPRSIVHFEHDCPKCIFIGHYDGFDCYVCPGILHGSIVARYGNDGPQYASTPLCALKTVLENPETAKVDYAQAWIKAMQTVAMIAKLLPFADTLQQLANQPDSKLIA